MDGWGLVERMSQPTGGIKGDEVEGGVGEEDWIESCEARKKVGGGWMENDQRTELGFRGWCGRVEDGRWICEHPTTYDARSAETSTDQSQCSMML